jgi:hypothetical protein
MRFTPLEILILAIPVLAFLFWATPRIVPILRRLWGTLCALALALAVLLAAILVVGRS